MTGGSSEAHALVDRLSAHYDAAVAALREALRIFLEGGPPPSIEARRAGLFAYPLLAMEWPEGRPQPRLMRAYARLSAHGRYIVSITHPELFRAYLVSQIDMLAADYGASFSVEVSAAEIPYPYVLDGSGLSLDTAAASTLARYFPTTELRFIGDELADGLWTQEADTPRPLGLFDARRVDFSLARLRHYTGTLADHTQSYILFTNYHRYADEFLRWACAELKREGTPYIGLSCPGGTILDRDTADPALAEGDGSARKHQMPAYHLMTRGGDGVTLVNIGVGPSNAKTITDHLAVLRPHAWLMIGHCGGLRPSQTIGDYVLAHAYLRLDHVLDEVLPPEIPIPPIAEVQQALTAAASDITGLDTEALKTRLRTGTVVTSDDRNWELRLGLTSRHFSLSRAVAIDMESATIAAQGYRFRVPYGTLLCVSDKPLHGEIKLPGQANRFYEGAISEHLRIGIEAISHMQRKEARLHSRKLRAFNEPPFR